MARKKVIIIGGGAAGLMAAVHLCTNFDIAIYEKGKTIGRKFLVAGNGGFNLTNQVNGDQLTNYYLPNHFLKKSLLENDSVQMRKWLAELDIPTFIGSSGRVFPEKGIKPIHVLNKIKNRLIENGVKFFFHHNFVGFDNDRKVIVMNQENEFYLDADFFIFSLGGASWSVTGSDGKWVPAFEKLGIKTIPFQPSNCGLNIDWPENFKHHHSGKPLKNIKITINDFEVKGEATITEYGLEGNAIYPLTWKIREAIAQRRTPIIKIDFKPLNSSEQLLQKIKNKPPKTKAFTQALNLNASQIALIKSFSSKEEFLKPPIFINSVKQLQIPIQGLRPMDEAISTVGGIALSEVNEDFSLKKHPSFFIIGEMLNWDAPTGGFLLQACFSMAQAISIK